MGVDTHARNHVYAIIDAANGALLDTQSFPSTAAGINRAVKWVVRRTNADADTLWVIEGAASYGAILAGTVAAPGVWSSRDNSLDASAGFDLVFEDEVGAWINGFGVGEVFTEFGDGFGFPYGMHWI